MAEPIELKIGQVWACEEIVGSREIVALGPEFIAYRYEPDGAIFTCQRKYFKPISI